MDSATIRKIIAFILIVCLFVGLIVLCVVIFDRTLSKPEKTKVVLNATSDDYDRTTESVKDHRHHRQTTTISSSSSSSSILSTTASTSTSTVSVADNQEIEYELKLKGGPEGNSGKVLVEHKGAIGFVCHDEFDDMDAMVVCRELGFTHGFSYKLMPYTSTSYKRFTKLDPMLSGLRCHGNESKLSDCEGFRIGNVTTCTWFAAALCFNHSPYEMRLVGGVQPNSGMVEMRVGGVWGVFCGVRDFDDDVADVLCRTMNFTGGFTMNRGMLGETPRSKVWVPYISCKDQVDSFMHVHSIFECDLVLNVENIPFDFLDFRNNRYRNEYMACLNKQNSYAAAVQCLI